MREARLLVDDILFDDQHVLREVLTGIRDIAYETIAWNYNKPKDWSMLHLRLTVECVGLQWQNVLSIQYFLW